MCYLHVGKGSASPIIVVPRLNEVAFSVEADQIHAKPKLANDAPLLAGLISALLLPGISTFLINHLLAHTSSEAFCCHLKQNIILASERYLELLQVLRIFNNLMYLIFNLTYTMRLIIMHSF